MRCRYPSDAENGSPDFGGEEEDVRCEVRAMHMHML